MAECIFCQGEATTKEHVIPRWLQRHFDLTQQRLGLWNGTSISYSQAVVPSCATCNSVRFSKLERRVQQGQASERDYYLWALKMRWGLSQRDTTLLLDRAQTERGPLMPPSRAGISEDVIRHAFRGVDSPTFTFWPEPFGSVFIIEQSPDLRGTFGFVDVPAPFWALAVTLPSDRILAVLFGDRGVVRRHLSRHGIVPFEDVGLFVSGMSADIVAFQLLRYQLLFHIPEGVRLLENGLATEPIKGRVKPRRSHRREYYDAIAALTGQPPELAEYAYSMVSKKY